MCRRYTLKSLHTIGTIFKILRFLTLILETQEPLGAEISTGSGVGLRPAFRIAAQLESLCLRAPPGLTSVTLEQSALRAKLHRETAYRPDRNEKVENDEALFRNSPVAVGLVRPAFRYRNRASPSGSGDG